MDYTSSPNQRRPSSAPSSASWHAFAPIRRATRSISTALVLLSFTTTPSTCLEIPDYVAVAIVTDNFEIGLDGVKRSWQTHGIEIWARSKWVEKFGPITKEDEDEYWTFGCLRFHTVLHHYDI